MGILSCHCLEVLKQENIVLIEEKYIVNRWRKDFKRANMVITRFQDSDYAQNTR
jgi:hypothetical protein